jgi:hypothetical protein
MPARRLEDRIRELCGKALFQKDPDWSRTILELQAAIQQHSLRVANVTTAVTVAGQPQIMRERRRP